MHGCPQYETQVRVFTPEIAVSRVFPQPGPVLFSPHQMVLYPLAGRISPSQMGPCSPFGWILPPQMGPASGPMTPLGRLSPSLLAPQRLSQTVPFLESLMERVKTPDRDMARRTLTTLLYDSDIDEIRRTAEVGALFGLVSMRLEVGRVRPLDQLVKLISSELHTQIIIGYFSKILITDAGFNTVGLYTVDFLISQSLLEGFLTTEHKIMLRATLKKLRTPEAINQLSEPYSVDESMKGLIRMTLRYPPNMPVSFIEANRTSLIWLFDDLFQDSTANCYAVSVLKCMKSKGVTCLLWLQRHYFEKGTLEDDQDVRLAPLLANVHLHPLLIELNLFYNKFHLKSSELIEDLILVLSGTALHEKMRKHLILIHHHESCDYLYIKEHGHEELLKTFDQLVKHLQRWAEEPFEIDTLKATLATQASKVFPEKSLDSLIMGKDIPIMNTGGYEETLLEFFLGLDVSTSCVRGNEECVLRSFEHQSPYVEPIVPASYYKVNEGLGHSFTVTPERCQVWGKPRLLERIVKEPAQRYLERPLQLIVHAEIVNSLKVRLDLKPMESAGSFIQRLLNTFPDLQEEIHENTQDALMKIELTEINFHPLLARSGVLHASAGETILDEMKRHLPARTYPQTIAQFLYERIAIGGHKPLPLDEIDQMIREATDRPQDIYLADWNYMADVDQGRVHHSVVFAVYDLVMKRICFAYRASTSYKYFSYTPTLGSWTFLLPKTTP